MIEIQTIEGGQKDVLHQECQPLKKSVVPIKLFNYSVGGYLISKQSLLVVNKQPQSSFTPALRKNCNPQLKLSMFLLSISFCQSLLCFSLGSFGFNSFISFFVLSFYFLSNSNICHLTFLFVFLSFSTSKYQVNVKKNCFILTFLDTSTTPPSGPALKKTG